MWFILVLICYFAFLMPGVPEYGNARQTLIHGGITLGALWVVSYVVSFILVKENKIVTTI